MRDHFTLGTTILLVAVACFAQSQVIETAQSDLGSGRTGFTVRNNGQLPITGIIVTATHYDASGKWLATGKDCLDSVLNGKFWIPLKPLDSRGFEAYPHSGEARTEFAVRAAVFSDGTTYGEAEWIEGFLSRRAAVHRYLGMVLEQLDLAAVAVPSEAALLDQLKQMKRRLESEIELDYDIHSPKPERSALTHVFSVVTGDLNQQSHAKETWPERIRRVEYRCRSMRRELEAARPRVVSHTP